MMQNPKNLNFLSKRFLGFKHYLSDEQALNSQILNLIGLIQTSRQLNIVGDSIFYFFDYGKWSGPFFEVLGQKDAVFDDSNELQTYNFREFSDFYWSFPQSSITEFKFSYASKQLSSLMQQLPQGLQVVATVLSCDINKIELHFFLQ